ncbi:hypothetical protein H5T51_05540, partial [Candidatus Bathyarchaeota archaeon]|nr:hypothetical protein [Candidatus Bathyarchaeota archaeon]
SDILNAPLEKLDKTAEKLVRELKALKAEKRRLIREIAKKAAVGVVTQSETEITKELNGVKLIERDFGSDLNTEMMISMASEITKKDKATVALFYGSDGKTARIIVMAGEEAVKKGVNAAEIAKEASKLIGGGGGGRPNFGQGGGIKVGNLREALNIAEEVLKKQIEKRK